MEVDMVIILTVFTLAWLALVVAVAVLMMRVGRLRRRIDDLQQRSTVHIQKLKLDSEQQHAFHNPAISPNEELAKRGFSMYNADDVESARGAHADRQTGGEFVEELSRELDSRQQRQASINQDRTQQERVQQDRMQQERVQDRHTLPQQHNRQQTQEQQWQQVQQHQSQHPPPFLLQSIEENKRKSRNLANPVANGGRQSDTNPNFIY
ncbi:ataxin-2 homolog [Pectinophora gossypiella]|uniref:ataxin-2 homolog n=1 Tax=Pectinophora gossypiella TaxID=13191 RepID=UPI00214E144E|nr:ataxin-2 homolog [Pectinophora gossypiella]